MLCTCLEFILIFRKLSHKHLLLQKSNELKYSNSLLNQSWHNVSISKTQRENNLQQTRHHPDEEHPINDKSGISEMRAKDFFGSILNHIYLVPSQVPFSCFIIWGEQDSNSSMKPFYFSLYFTLLCPFKIHALQVFSDWPDREASFWTCAAQYNFTWMITTPVFIFLDPCT